MTAPLEWSGPFAEISLKFDAFPDVSGDAQMEKDLCVSITSAEVDIVTRVSSAGQCCAYSDWDDTIQNIHQWRECASPPKDTRNITLTDTEANFWTTILRGCLLPSASTLHTSPSSYERITNSDLDLIPHWQARLHDPSRNPDLSMFQTEHTNAVDVRWLSKAEGFSRFNQRLHYAMMTKRFFVTEKGRFGAGAGSGDLEHFTKVEEGDEVHLVGGVVCLWF
jgi:hypothetical protein